jgi:hypothetical protein
VGSTAQPSSRYERATKGDNQPMKRLLLLGTGMAVGYVLGARAGRERYDQIVAMSRKAWSGAGLDARTHQVGSQVGATAREASGLVADAATTKLAEVADLVKEHRATAPGATG